MKRSDLLALASETFRVHRTRAALTVGAVAIGATAVLLLTSLGIAAREYVVRQFTSAGANLVAVVPGRTETTGMGMAIGAATKDLTLEDAEAIARRSPNTRYVAPVSLGSARFEYGGRHRDLYVAGTTAQYFDIRSLAVILGQRLPPGDPRRGERVVVIGPTVRRELFGAENPLGKAVRIAGTQFRVIGVLESKGQSLGMDLDDLALIPVGSGLRLFNQSGLYRIVVQARDAASIPAAVRDTKEILTDRHRDEDFTVITQDAMLSSFSSIVGMLTFALAGIGAISLAVAGIGIMNVMLVSVSERIGEIGLLKALGAAPRTITALFLTEAVLLSGAGAVAGIAIGFALMQIETRIWPSFPLVPSGGWVATIVALALVVGAVFGFLPARRASRLEAVEALRGKR
ncbi:MAG: ABC transporter permease [Bacteroidota bacterium]